MAKCTYCGTETRLYHHGFPICVECSDRIDAGEKLTPKQENERGEKERKSE